MRAASIVFVLSALTASASHAAPTGRDTIAVDGGPGREMTTVREGDRGGANEGEVLDFTDGSGARIRVYADHPVTRSEVEARLAEARRQTQDARIEGRRAAAEGLRAMQEARQDAEHARTEELRAAEEGRREAEMGRREVDQARAETLRVAEQGRREAEQARVEAAQAAADLR